MPASMQQAVGYAASSSSLGALISCMFYVRCLRSSHFPQLREVCVLSCCDATGGKRTQGDLGLLVPALS